MKNIRRVLVKYLLFTIVAALAVFTPQRVFSGGTEYALVTANAIVVNVLSVGGINPLNFGKISQPETQVWAVVDASGSIVPGLSTADWYDPSTSAGEFDISGPPNMVLDVDIPSGTFTISGPAGSSPMTVSDLATDLVVPGKITLDSEGLATVKIGGKLTIAANQDVGNYNNPEALTITVSY